MQAIPIESWFKDPDDDALTSLIPILEEVAQSNDAVELTLERILPRELRPLPLPMVNFINMKASRY